MDIKMESLQVNCETGEETLVPLTAAELAEMQARKESLIAEQTKREENAIARTALLARLGITQEEAQLLLGGN
jgi:hypothetical protein